MLNTFTTIHGEGTVLCTPSTNPAFYGIAITFFILGCTSLIPKIGESHAHSGFSQEFFTHLVTKYTLNAKLLSYVVMELPDNTMTSAPYNAACLSLKPVLAKTTEGPVIEQLLRWGIKVKMEDVMYAVEALNNLQVRGRECAW